MILLEHFDELFVTPAAVDELDRAILQLAVQGKLVPQDSNDEPASELLKRIQASRNEQEQIWDTHEETLDSDLPANWMWTTLPQIGQVNPRNSERDNTKEASFIPMAYIPEEYGAPFKFDVRPWGEIRKQFTHLQDNDVAVAKITPCFENGKAIVFRNLVNGIGAGTTELHVFRGNPNWIVPEYVLLFFKNAKFVVEGKRRMTGSAGQQRVPKEHVTETPFPLPPLPEQHRIVVRVEQLFAQTRALREKLAHAQTELERVNESALAHLLAAETPQEFSERWSFIAQHFDTLYAEPEHIAPLRQTILELAVRGKLTRRAPDDEPASQLLERIRQEKNKLAQEGKIKNDALPPIQEQEKPFELPEGWEWVRLNDICYQITDGTHVTPVYVSKGVPFLSVKDLSSGYINFNNTKFISLETHQLFASRCKPERGDVLLTKVGTTGIAVVVDTDREFSIFVSVALLKFFQKEILPDYLSLLINSPYVKRQSEKYTMGVGNKNLVLKHIKTFMIPIPPLAEQRRIVARVEQLMKLCDALEAKLTAAQDERERLTTALLARIGSGEGGDA